MLVGGTAEVSSLGGVLVQLEVLMFHRSEMNFHIRKMVLEFQTRSDKNRPLQSKKKARCLKLWILVVDLHYPFRENKGEDKL